MRCSASATGQELLDTFEREVWRRNLRRDLPEGDARTQFQSVTVSQSPYMLETDGDTAVFQFSLEINYIERNEK